MTPQSFEQPGFETNTPVSPEVHKTIFENTELLNRCYEKAEDYLDEYRIKLDEDTFPNYNPTVLADANKEVDKLEKRFAEQAQERDVSIRKISVIMEAILTSMTENDWFGPDAQMITPSRYDDVKNGVDGCLEFSDTSNVDYLALSIDFTYSSNSALAKKIRAIDLMLRSEGQGFYLATFLALHKCPTTESHPIIHRAPCIALQLFAHG